jgi:hypothetical protein
VQAVVEAERCRAGRVLGLNSVRSEPILSEIGLGEHAPATPENLE